MVSDEELDRRIARYADEARVEAAPTVNLLEMATSEVASDLGIDSEPPLMSVAWLPAVHADEVSRLPPTRGLPWADTEWLGGVSFRGRHSLLIDVDVRYERQLPFQIGRAVQDSVIEEVAGARPACPVHGHPLAPRATQDDSVWECPADPEIWSCSMGTYRQAAGSS